MPTYEYGCDACGKQWEAEQRITEAAIKKCPKCGKLKAKRLISGGNFMLKGGGWYADGYGSKKSSASKSESSSTKSEGAKSEGAKSESPKGEAKSDAKPSSTSGAADS